MTTDIAAKAFKRGIDPVIGLLTPDQAKHLADYHADDSLQERIECLANRSNEGELTEEENAEYLGYVRANRFLSVLRASSLKRTDIEEDRPMPVVREAGIRSGRFSGKDKALNSSVPDRVFKLTRMIKDLEAEREALQKLL